MLIKKLTISNFRNIKQADVTFGTGLNVIYGANGQGKTNLLEAVYLLALADTYRTNNESELITFGADTALLHANFQTSEKENAKQTCDLGLEIKKLAANKTKKIFSKDNLAITRVADFVGNFNAVLFAPEDLLLIKSGPQQRRQFMNRVLAQAKRTYIFNLQQLNQLLLYKNRLLKELQQFDAQTVTVMYKDMLTQVKKNNEIDRNYLSNLLADFAEVGSKQLIRQKIGLLLTLNKKFVSVASQIILERKQLIASFNELVQKYQHLLSLGKELLSIRYLTFCNLAETANLAEIAELLSQKVEQSFFSDLFKGHSSIGPQRDDLEFFLNAKNCRMYASQGQQRTVILTLKLAECDFLTSIKQVEPVLLLDDVLSELDSKRQQALLTNILNRQVLLTCTELELTKDNLIDSDKIVYFFVNQGEIN